MRLICPSCGAQYEVPDEVIPTEGRDVQCSNCSNTWFQPHPDQDEQLADEMDAPSIEEVAPPPAPDGDTDTEEHTPQVRPRPEKRELDPNIASVLREEAEHEAAARAAESGAPLESQPDLGLDTPQEDESTRRAREARDRMARIRGETVSPEAAVAEVTASVGSRRDLLPDIEEINSTLRASGDRKRPAEATDADIKGTTPKTRSKMRSFRFGFYGVILLGLIAGGVYVYSPRIATSLPAAAPLLSSYTQNVDKARSWLSTSLDAVLARLDQMASENL